MEEVVQIVTNETKIIVHFPKPTKGTVDDMIEKIIQTGLICRFHGWYENPDGSYLMPLTAYDGHEAEARMRLPQMLSGVTVLTPDKLGDQHKMLSHLHPSINADSTLKDAMQHVYNQSLNYFFLQ